VSNELLFTFPQPLLSQLQRAIRFSAGLEQIAVKGFDVLPRLILIVIIAAMQAKGSLAKC
jgi:hypothetical protein